MFRTLIYPSSGACEYSVELPHWLYCSWFDVCWSFGVFGLEWCPCCRLKQPPTQPHRNSNTHRTKNNTTNVVIQQNIRKLLMMGILMFETCRAHKKWNKIASDIKLVFYSSTTTNLICWLIIKFVMMDSNMYVSFNVHNKYIWQSRLIVEWSLVEVHIEVNFGVQGWGLMPPPLFFLPDFFFATELKRVE